MLKGSPSNSGLFFGIWEEGGKQTSSKLLDAYMNLMTKTLKLGQLWAAQEQLDFCNMLFVGRQKGTDTDMSNSSLSV